MEYLIEGITEDEMSKVLAGTCNTFTCAWFSDMCRIRCKAVVCSGFNCPELV